MEDVKLVLLDLDGTLLDEKSKVPVEFYDLVIKLREKRVNVGIASGRNKSSLEVVFGDLFNQMACITNNGCANFIDGNMISADYLDPEVCEKLLNKADEDPNISFQLFFPDYILMKEGNPLIEMLNGIGFKAKPCSNLKEHFKDGVVLVSLIDQSKKDHIEEFSHLGGDYKMVTPGLGVIDITPGHVSKAYGADRLAQKLNISVDQIMALGDAGNDLALLEHVGYPVAMKNGMEEVKKKAKYITKYTNIEHGAIRFLEEFFEL